MSTAAGSEYMLRCVFFCFFSGFALGLLYTVFEMLRVILGVKKLGTILFDCMIFAAAAVITYLLAFAMNRGQLRFFQLSIEIIGLCVCLLTLHPLLMYPTEKIRFLWNKACRSFSEKWRRFSAEKKKKHRKKGDSAENKSNLRKKSKKRLEKLM